jgi:hypothetical protein
MSEIKYGVSNRKALFFCPSFAEDGASKVFFEKLQKLLEELNNKNFLEMIIVDFVNCQVWDKDCPFYLSQLTMHCEELGLDIFSARMSKRLSQYLEESGVGSLLPDIAKSVSNREAD